MHACENGHGSTCSVCHHKLIIFLLSQGSATSGHSCTSVTLCFKSPFSIHKKGPQAPRLGELKVTCFYLFRLSCLDYRAVTENLQGLINVTSYEVYITILPELFTEMTEGSGLITGAIKAF